MIKITYQGKPLAIPAPVERGLRLLAAGNFIAPKSAFFERRQKGFSTSLLPTGALSRVIALRGTQRNDLAQSTRAKKYFKSAYSGAIRSTIEGNPRTINAILRAIDKRRAA